MTKRAKDATWAEAVGVMIGPRLAGEGTGRQRLNALHLAAAALDAADEIELATELRKRIENIV